MHDIREVRVYYKCLVGIVSNTTPPCLKGTEDFSSPQNIGDLSICHMNVFSSINEP
jgi:hypothetical protein